MATTKPGGRLDGKCIAIIATALVEAGREPRQALARAGTTTELISLERDRSAGLTATRKPGTHRVDRVIAEPDEHTYAAQLIPGRVASADRLPPG